MNAWPLCTIGKKYALKKCSYKNYFGAIFLFLYTIMQPMKSTSSILIVRLFVHRCFFAGCALLAHYILPSTINDSYHGVLCSQYPMLTPLDICLGLKEIFLNNKQKLTYSKADVSPFFPHFCYAFNLISFSSLDVCDRSRVLGVKHHSTSPRHQKTSLKFMLCLP